MSYRPTVSPSPNIKQRGAYYTDYALASFLCQWALRSAHDSMLDPSFGGGVFLQTAFERLQQLGNKQSGTNIFGVELDTQTHTETVRFLSEKQEVLKKQVLNNNFFDIDPKQLKPLTTILGNPPFVRFQTQNKEEKEKALELCKKSGVELNMQCNLWVPFIIHSCNFLQDGGRLAFVIPQEIAQASYAKPLLSFLARSFEKTTFVSFEKSVFQDIYQDVVLLLAEGKGTNGKFYVKDLNSATLRELDVNSSDAIEPESFMAQSSFAYYWLDAKTRAILEQLKNSPKTTQLGKIASIQNGYVTGANTYFHLNEQQKKHFGLQHRHLKRSVFRTASLQGLSFTNKDWNVAEKAGKAGYVLNLPNLAVRSKSAQAYLEKGIEQKIPMAYKCRHRKPWHRVPNLVTPDAFLSYMSGPYLHLVFNDAKVAAPNSLHHLNMKTSSPLCLKQLCSVWPNSLTQLSAELTGRTLGGGMLKLEPSEAQKVLIPLVQPNDDQFEKIDKALRAKRHDLAQALANESLLTLISETELTELKENLRKLKRRRRKVKN